MGISQFDYQQMLHRLDRNDVREAKREVPSDAVAYEDKLHEDIINWCNEQWPKVKFIRCRMDVESTIAVGAQDFTLFLPGKIVVCIECKSRTGKLSRAQRDWRTEMGMVGQTVHEVRSMTQFLETIRKAKEG